MNKKLKRNIAVVLMVVAIPLALKVNAADTISKYEEQLEAVKKEQQENAKKLTGVEKELALYAYDVAEIDSQNNEYSKKLATIRKDKEKVEKKLEELEENLEKANEGFSVVNSQYAKRLRSIYEDGYPSIFELLITSNGFSDFMVKLNLYSLILDRDKTLMNSFQDKQAYMNYIKEDIESEEKQLKAIEEQTVSLKKELDKSRQEKVDKMAELEQKQTELKEASVLLAERKKSAITDIDNEVAKVINDVAKQIQMGTSSTFTGTEFAYPTPGHTIITTSFGEVYNLVDPAGSAHTGADIAGAEINCSPIYAIQGGTVVTSGYSNYGYGNYIIINHGQCLDNKASYISLYGHCSSLAVEEGQTVEKGQLIGFVGTTGNSTGPHLHLELRINGERVDPLQLFPGIEFTVY